MAFSTPLSSYARSWLPAGYTATLSDTESLFRTNHPVSQAYQTVLATTHDYLTLRFTNDKDEPDNAPHDEVAAGQLSIDDARTRARTAWSRAYSKGHPKPRYNRPNISEALSTPPMPHIITDYTTSLLRQEYYMFLERCWNALEEGTTSNQADGSGPLVEVPPPITAYSFDLLGSDDSPLQAAVLAVNEDSSIDDEVFATEELPVDHSTLDRLDNLIDDLLGDDGASTISDRFMSIDLAEEDGSELDDSDKENSAPLLHFPASNISDRFTSIDLAEEDGSELEDSDKENSAPPLHFPASNISDRFTSIDLAEQDGSELEDSDKENSAPPLHFPNYESDEGDEESDTSSGLEGSDKENMRPLSPLSLFSDGYPLSGNSSGTPNVSFDRDDEYDELEDSDKEPLEPGALSTLFYDPYVEFAREDVPNDFLEASDEENESELEDSDKENNPAPSSLPRSDQGDDEQHAPSDNALMLIFDDNDSAGYMGDYEDSVPSDDEQVVIVGDFEHDRDDSVCDDTNSDPSRSEQNLQCSSSPYSSFSTNEGLTNCLAELNDAPHFAYNPNISTNEKSVPPQNGTDDSDASDGGYANLSDDHHRHLTEEQATESDAGAPAIPIGSQRRLIGSKQPFQNMMQRPIARLPRRSTINRAKYQNEHLIDGVPVGPGINDEPIEGYFSKCTSFGPTSAGSNEFDRFSSATDARTGAANQYDHHNTPDSEQEDWTDERRVFFPTSYERTPMDN